MEDWEEAHEDVKADINELKDQVGQILEALKLLKASGEASSARVEENAHSYGMPLGASVSFPMYGLPLGYTPPVGEYSDAEQTYFSFPAANNTLSNGTQGPMLASTPVTRAEMNETVTFTGPRMTVAPQPPKTFIDADATTKDVPHATVQAISIVVDGAKSKLES